MLLCKERGGSAPRNGAPVPPEGQGVPGRGQYLPAGCRGLREAVSSGRSIMTSQGVVTAMAAGCRRDGPGKTVWCGRRGGVRKDEVWLQVGPAPRPDLWRAHTVWPRGSPCGHQGFRRGPCLTTHFKLLNARPERDALGSGPVVPWSSMTRATVRLGQTCFLLSPGGRSTLGSGAKWS